MAEFKFKLETSVPVWNKYEGLDKVVTSVSITMICREAGKEVEESRTVQLIREGDEIDPVTFVPFPDGTASKDERDAFKQQLITWAKDALSAIEVPDPDAEFSDIMVDQLTLWKRNLQSRLATGQTEKRRVVKTIAL